MPEINQTSTLSALLVLTLTACLEGPPMADDEAGSTTEPGGSESSDSSDSSDSTTGEAFEACEFEWLVRTPTAEGWAQLTIYAPMVLDGQDLVIAHPRTHEGQVDSRLTRASQSDGTIGQVLDFNLSATKDYPQSLARLPDGDLLLGSTAYGAAGAEVRRLGPNGELRWTWSDPASVFLAGLARLPDGRGLSLTTREVGDLDEDAALVVHDLETGAQLETHEFGGMPTPAGTSFDPGWSLAVGDAGVFFGMNEVGDGWGRPVVFGLDPSDLALPRWRTPLIDLPGQNVALRSVALGPAGPLAVIYENFESEEFWISALDPETGVILWTVESNELELPELVSSRLTALALSDERVFVAGNWLTTNEELSQGFVLALDLEGNAICQSTWDDFDPETGAFEYAPYFLDAKVDAEGALLLSGLNYHYWNPTLPIELLLAKVH